MEKITLDWLLAQSFTIVIADDEFVFRKANIWDIDNFYNMVTESDKEKTIVGKIEKQKEIIYHFLSSDNKEKLSTTLKNATVKGFNDFVDVFIKNLDL